MRPLLQVMILLAGFAVAEELRSVTAKYAEPHAETVPASFRLSGALDLGVVSADAGDLLPGADISSNAPTSELRTFRLLGPLGYYPADRAFDSEAGTRPLGADDGDARSTSPHAAGARASF